MPTYTNKQIAESLKACKGMVYLASKRLGCCHHTILKRVRAHPDLQAILDSERGQVVDIAEVKLMEALKDNHGWAIAFTLRTLGKDRGYVERQETTGKDGGAIQTENVTFDDDRRRKRLEALLDRARARRIQPA